MMTMIILMPIMTIENDHKAKNDDNDDDISGPRARKIRTMNVD